MNPQLEYEDRSTRCVGSKNISDRLLIYLITMQHLVKTMIFIGIDLSKEDFYLDMSRDMTSIQAKEERKKNWSKMAMAVQHKGVL
jgi:hypothetical protein